ncbi:MAG: hypothetical protein NZ651_06860 [Candidatus Bipolaricaulota bacterium]|nr:hypothetical protein [Candidatus Bipolaricaulota bacterium]MDW8127474.1 hypothetical protein [Candidatus Bipolaricaulota bacterium]
MDNGWERYQELVLSELRDLKKAVGELQELISCELYGVNGREGLKQRVAVLWSEREQHGRWRMALVGAVLTAIASLAVTLVRWALGV